eukprot:scaffold56880_cov64-Phaeocystis_antarctica.AAC.3
MSGAARVPASTEQHDHECSVTMSHDRMHVGDKFERDGCVAPPAPHIYIVQLSARALPLSPALPLPAPRCPPPRCDAEHRRARPAAAAPRGQPPAQCHLRRALRPQPGRLLPHVPRGTTLPQDARLGR